MNTTPEWREEFIRKFCSVADIEVIVRGELKEEGYTAMLEKDATKVMDFIKNLLTTERARIVERLEKEIALHKEIIRIHERGVFPKSWHEGKIEAFDQAIDIIKDNK
jgi:hypothetical protein